MKNKLNKLTPKIIGYISVDAGIVWIGDPCYIIHPDKTPESIGNNWFDFCANLNEGATAFTHDNGRDGLGVCTLTKYGDGEYAVIGFFEGDSNRPSCVVVDFNGVFSK